MAALITLACILSFLAVIHFTAAHMEKKGLVNYRFRKPSSTSVGTALQELNAIAQPSTYHAIEAMNLLPSLPDEEDAGDDGKPLTVQIPADRLRVLRQGK